MSISVKRRSRAALQFDRASNYQVDVAVFTALLDACDRHVHRHPESCKMCAQQLQQAVALYHGPFLAEACKRAPHAVVCLLSALRFHNIGTQNPFEIWLAIDRKARRPQVDYPPLRIVRFSGAALTEGVEEVQIEGVTVRVYSVAKTVADCFKYRNKIGLDVALEALRDCLHTRRCTHQELWRYAKICRVSNVMQPYLEAITY